MARRARRILVVVRIVVLAVSGLSCSSAGREPAVPVQARRPLPQATATAEELAAIRSVVLQHYQDAKPEHWEAFVVELRRGAVFLAGTLYEGSPPAIGRWHFELADGRYALVRQPPVPDRFPALFVYFGVYLAREGEAWRVTGEYLLYEEVDAVE